MTSYEAARFRHGRSSIALQIDTGRYPIANISEAKIPSSFRSSLVECYGSRGSCGPNENALHPKIGQPDHLLSRAVLFGGAIGFLPRYAAQGKGARFCDHAVAISAAPCAVAMDCCAAAIQAKELIRGCDSLLRVDYASDRGPHIGPANRAIYCSDSKDGERCRRT